jgi:hypothetical protein
VLWLVCGTAHVVADSDAPAAQPGFGLHRELPGRWARAPGNKAQIHTHRWRTTAEEGGSPVETRCSSDGVVRGSSDGVL